MSAWFVWPEQKRSLGTPRLMREDSIKCMESMDRISLAQDRDKWRAFVKRVLTLEVA